MYGAGDRAGLTFDLDEGARFGGGDVLLFQHSVPGFSPSPQSYAPAVGALELTREQLAGYGVRDPRHVDVWTAMLTGLVDQQISNDPGGDRWTRLVDDVVRMFLTHCSHEEDL